MSKLVSAIFLVLSKKVVYPNIYCNMSTSSLPWKKVYYLRAIFQQLACFLWAHGTNEKSKRFLNQTLLQALSYRIAHNRFCAQNLITTRLAKRYSTKIMKIYVLAKICLRVLFELQKKKDTWALLFCWPFKNLHILPTK